MNQTLQNEINTFQCNDVTPHLWCLKLSANDYYEILDYLSLLCRCATVYVAEYCGGCMMENPK